MSFSFRALLFRNFLVSSVSGLITLTILLIAPLGLAAVITCTAAVTISSFFVGTASDSVMRWLSAGKDNSLIERS